MLGEDETSFLNAAPVGADPVGVRDGGRGPRWVIDLIERPQRGEPGPLARRA